MTGGTSAIQRVPGATYRLQFNRQFTFAQATALAQYLRELGITDCYASPLFKARPESTHGYDICSFSELNPNLGTTADFERFTAHLRQLNLGLVLDMVPNHMATDLSNGWWYDVLENGKRSPHATFFDIDWHPLEADLRDRVLLPILEDDYAKVLEAGKIQLLFSESRFFLSYYDRRFPVSPESYSVSAALQRLIGRAGDPQSFDQLHALLQHQHYRLASWRTAHEQINYRRFFDVTELISLRMELPEVFQAAHELLFRLLRDGQVTGLRIDHPDGLWNPKQYFSRLQSAFPHLYIVAEKILSGDETLPGDWPVAGTTGYDFLNRVNGLFVDRTNEQVFNEIYQRFTGCSTDFKEAARASKKKILQTSFLSELKSLTARLQRLAASSGLDRDFTFNQLQASLTEIIAAFPVYRTYVTEETVALSVAEQECTAQALNEAAAQCPDRHARVLQFVGNLLLLRPTGNSENTAAAREFVMKFQQLTGPVTAKSVEDTAFYTFNRLVSLNEVGGDPAEFGVTPEKFHAHNQAQANRWPHSLLATATHDTKRGEDVRARINVLSEMPDAWDQAVTRWKNLNAIKKSSVKGEPAPQPNDEYLLYQTLVGAWPPEADGSGGLKDFSERCTACLLKSVREAKAHTSWTDPDSAYETALKNFIGSILADSGPNPFLDDFKTFQRKVAFFGHFNSLSQTLLKITSPGVPDFYQGSELWDFSLVDPDNRRPVDYQVRQQLLAGLKKMLPNELLQTSHTGQIKLFLIWKALQFRRRHSELFSYGSFLPLSIKGPKGNHAVAFARQWNDQTALIIAPRLVAGLTKGAQQAPLGRAVWQDTTVELTNHLCTLRYRNVFTDEMLSDQEFPRRQGLSLANALSHFPLALLEAS
ncbi:MAG: 4-alpha-glucanotransferase [Verrucomicrobiota bacterium]